MPADAVDTHRHGRSVVRILLHDGSVRVLNTSELKKIVGEEEHVRFKQASGPQNLHVAEFLGDRER